MTLTVAEQILEAYENINQDDNPWENVFYDYPVHPIQEQLDGSYIAVFQDGSALTWSDLGKIWNVDDRTVEEITAELIKE